MGYSMLIDRLKQFRLSGEKILVFIFLATCVFVNPNIRGDGNGYYAYVRSIIIDKDLDFYNEYQHADPKFQANKGHWAKTPTGLTQNLWAPGSALLWMPFFIGVHFVVNVLNFFGVNIPADGFSFPYRWAVAFESAFYAFVGLFLCYRLAKEYFSHKVAFVSVIAIWFASSVPVYMYLLPSSAHANALFTASLFIYYWHHTKGDRKSAQWVLLGLIGGFSAAVRYETVIFLSLPAIEIVLSLYKSVRTKAYSGLARQLGQTAELGFGVLAGLLPVFITKTILYGSPLATGYYFSTTSIISRPHLPIRMLFSSTQGLFSWTPVLLFANIGWIFFFKKERILAAYLSVPFLGYMYLTSCWSGIIGTSYGNRFFVSCTLIFVLGLAAFIDWICKRASLKWLSVGFIFLIIWNFLLIVQFGLGLVPRDAYLASSFSWTEVVKNQARVPILAAKYGKLFFQDRERFIQVIQEIDSKQRARGEQL